MSDDKPSGTQPSVAQASVEALAHVRIPAFWKQSPALWFVHAESVFANNRVTANATRVNHVVSALDEEGVRTVGDLLGRDASYESIKQRLVESYEQPKSSRFREMVQPGGIGDRRPSQLLRDMRAILPDGIGEEALREFWMQKLPSNVLTVIAGLDGPLDALATRADRVMEAISPSNVDAIGHAHDRINELTTVVEELSHEVKTLNSLTRMVMNRLVEHTSEQPQTRSPEHVSAPARKRSSERNSAPALRRSPEQQHPSCYYHTRYSAAAKNCRHPCGFRPRQRGSDPPPPAEN